MTGDTMLEFSHVSLTYPKDPQPTIKDLSFTIQKGEFVSLIGPSGCGKSTILRLTNRLLIPDSGTIRVGGTDIRHLTRYCGYMPQHDLLFPWKTVAENIRLPLEIRGGMKKADMDALVKDALKNVGLEGMGDKSPSEFSGGMRQRAAFARTLLTGCDLLVLDEPFSALDYLTRLNMREWLLGQWQREQKTILFITHDVEEALFLSCRVLAAQESPIQSLSSIPVPAGYPRSLESLRLPAIGELRERLILKLRRASG